MLKTITARIMVSVIIAALFSIAAVLTPIWYGRVIRGEAMNSNVDTMLLEALEEMNSATQRAGIAIRENVLNMNLERIGGVGQAKAQQLMSASLKGKYVDKAHHYISKTDAEFKKVQQLTAGKGNLSQQVEALGKVWTKTHKDYLSTISYLKKMQYAGAMHELVTKVNPASTKMASQLTHLISTVNTQANNEKEAVLGDISFSNVISLALMGLAIVVGTILVSWAVFSMRRRLHSTVSTMEDIAQGEGDLTRRMSVNGKDELDLLADAFNRFVERIQKVVSQVADSTVRMAAASEELSATSEETSEHVRKQQGEIDQVAASMNETSSTVQEVSKNASDASRAAQEADGATREGQEVVAKTMRAITEMADEVEKTAEVIHTLENDSAQIGVVLEVINGISEQTNLLALNAAIEAARAGEQGRGFAVVADEVRTLAKRTQDSTEEIRSMIERLQGGAKNAVDAMVSGRDKAQGSVDQAKQAEVSLQTISQAVSQINDMNALIASAAEEQSAVAEEINRNISNISHATEQTSTGAQQTAGASEELARLAADLKTLVNQFNV